jgi:hypothetical protein
MGSALRIGSLFAASLFWVLSFGNASRAEDAPKPPRIVKLALSPSAPGRPALKHSLMIEPHERTPGNAAPLYYRAMLTYKDHAIRHKWELALKKSTERWTEGPCSQELRDELRGWLKEFPTDALNYVREATRRERCDFEHRREELTMPRDIKVGLNEYDLVPLARMIRYQARVDISDAKFLEARESLRQLYQMGMDSSSDPSIIAATRGVWYVTDANEEVVHWIGSDGSPNLYWALSAIPQPFIDVRPICFRELRGLETFLAPLKDCETARRSDDEWAKVIGDIVVEANPDAQKAAPLDQIASFDALIQLHYPTSKAWLIDNGYGAENLIGKPRGQVVAIHMTRMLREITDEFAKGIYLPKDQIDAYYAALEAKIGKELDPLGRYNEIVPIARLFMPAVHPALTVQSRVELEFAGLRTLEAIRAHVAETGALPEKLEDIKVVPLPVDPITSKPFDYATTETGATLTIPALRRVPVKHYELTIREK